MAWEEKKGTAKQGCDGGLEEVLALNSTAAAAASSLGLLGCAAVCSVLSLLRGGPTVEPNLGLVEDFSSVCYGGPAAPPVAGYARKSPAALLPGENESDYGNAEAEVQNKTAFMEGGTNARKWFLPAEGDGQEKLHAHLILCPHCRAQFMTPVHRDGMIGRSMSLLPMVVAKQTNDAAMESPSVQPRVTADPTCVGPDCTTTTGIEQLCVGAGCPPPAKQGSTPRGFVTRETEKSDCVGPSCPTTSSTGQMTSTLEGGCVAPNCPPLAAAPARQQVIDGEDEEDDQMGIDSVDPVEVAKGGLRQALRVDASRVKEAATRQLEELANRLPTMARGMGVKDESIEAATIRLREGTPWIAGKVGDFYQGVQRALSPLLLTEESSSASQTDSAQQAALHG